MEIDNVQEIPADMYPFSNFLDRDVTLYWDSRAYTFPALSTTNLMGRIPKATPEDVQGIRKKFAFDLAKLAYYETEDYKMRERSAPMNDIQQGIMKTPALYSESSLEPLVERCLQPLPVQAPVVEDHSEAKQKELESRLSKDEKGRPRSRVVKQGDNLKPYEDD